jgi:ribosome biogenesis GTPase
VRFDAKFVQVELEGQTVACTPRGRLYEARSDRKNPLAVGDLVRIDLESDPPSVDEVLRRRNYFGKTASSHDPREQILFANVDQLLIIASVQKPLFSSVRADRILAACVWHDIPARVVLNKIDLDRRGEAQPIADTYRAAGYEVLLTSAKSGAGLKELRSWLRGVTTALYGASGVGKTSLLNALEPGLGLAMGKISRYWDAGKHTTSFSQLVPLGMGGCVIDTPGIRTFRIHGIAPERLRDLFPEFARVAGRCRFPDCTHDHEPDCAVSAAVEAGALPASRYASYLTLLEELGQSPSKPDGALPPDES